MKKKLIVTVRFILSLCAIIFMAPIMFDLSHQAHWRIDNFHNEMHTCLDVYFDLFFMSFTMMLLMYLLYFKRKLSIVDIIVCVSIAVFFSFLFTSTYGIWSSVSLVFFIKMFLATLIGLLLSYVIYFAINRIKGEYKGDASFFSNFNSISFSIHSNLLFIL